jgi:hypothetical protein
MSKGGLEHPREREAIEIIFHFTHFTHPELRVANLPLYYSMRTMARECAGWGSDAVVVSIRSKCRR